MKQIIKLATNSKCQIVDGNQLARGIIAQVNPAIQYYLQSDFKAIKQSLGYPNLQPPCLAILLIGSNPASVSYVNKKMKLCSLHGIRHELFRFPSNATQKEIIDQIQILNTRNEVDSILVQLPLPKHLCTHDIIRSISITKDVDQLHRSNYYHLIQSTEDRSSILPCTPAGILYILDTYSINVQGMKTTVVGRSNLVGYPLALALIKRQAQVTISHLLTQNLEECVRRADLIVSAAGHRHLIKGEWIKEGAIVIDVGINKGLEQDGQKLVGDVEFSEAIKKASLITPVPGGVGPITVAMLLRNVYLMWCNKYNLQEQFIEETAYIT